MQPLSSAAARLADRIDAEEMLGQVQRWSAINSGTHNLGGLSAMADLLGDAFSALPGEVRLMEPDRVSAVDEQGREIAIEHGRHLVLQVRPDAKHRVLLTGHMDTVYAVDSPFQDQRWLDAERLNGPGVADMKGGLAVMLSALLALESDEAGRALGYDVVINSDEEAGSQSSSRLIAEFARGKLAALTYEPSMLPNGTLAGARGGSANFSVAVTGRSAHAGRNPEDGRNALVAAAALALGVKALDRPGLPVNPARIDGGSANNVVPDKAVLRFNIRPAGTEDAEAFEEALGELIEAVGRDHDVTIALHRDSSRPPKPLDPAALRLFELVRDCGAKLGQEIGWRPSGGVCDGNNIAALGVPVVDTMGVRGGAIHSIDEFLIVPSLSERAMLSALVLRRLAAGAIA